MIEFCNDTGLKSSLTRNAIVKLLGALREISDLGILSNVKPALLSALDTEFGKNPSEVDSDVEFGEAVVLDGSKVAVERPDRNVAFLEENISNMINLGSEIEEELDRADAAPQIEEVDKAPPEDFPMGGRTYLLLLVVISLFMGGAFGHRSRDEDQKANWSFLICGWLFSQLSVLIHYYSVYHSF
ncbi:hypothetical protein TorRG33x02_004480 [Trema orientale]|uniref:Transmembrane protein n=1 Tax=Trema orientale TaxID=63057 RepID=A0A2P5G258_TREOI|nr:hypothetical protein TorRG33x02_004480 [Trema orientale]